MKAILNITGKFSKSLYTCFEGYSLVYVTTNFVFSERKYPVDRKGRILGRVWISSAAGVQAPSLPQRGTKTREQK